MGISINDLSPQAQAQVARKVIEEARRREALKVASEANPKPKPPQRPEFPPAAPDLPLRYTILGDPRTKKNHPQIAGKGKRCPVCRKFETQWVRQGQAHDEYKKSALPQLTPVPERPIDTPVHIKCLFYMETHRRVDGLNLEAAVDDLLVEAGILADDNSQIVISHDGSRVFYDKHNPRTEITITRAGE